MVIKRKKHVHGFDTLPKKLQTLNTDQQASCRLCFRLDNCIVFTDIIKQLCNRNRNPLQEPEIASAEFHITGMTRPRRLLVITGPARKNQNSNRSNI